MSTIEDVFSSQRRFLWGLSYRMTGNAADADDVVQDTFVRMLEHRPDDRDSVRPWLVKVALNLSRDLLRTRKRRGYVGPWLPSPIATEDAAPPSHEPVLEGASPERQYDLLESVSFAFLVALEQLTPTQRGVLLLRDVFDYSVAETADALDLTEANVKTTHHRARRAMEAYNAARVRSTATVKEATGDALARFLRCLERSDVAGVEALLASDVQALTDGGGEFRSALRPIIGRHKVARFFVAIAAKGPRTFVTFTPLNGAPALIAVRPEATGPEAPRYAVAIDLNQAGKITRVYVVSAPRKLGGIASAFDRVGSLRGAEQLSQE